MSLSKCPFPAFAYGAITTAIIFYSLKHLQSQSKHKNLLPKLNHHEYEEELEVAIDCAIRAGEKIKLALENDKLIHSKGRANDFVTETDKGNEELIFSTLRQRFPHHKFIGEVFVTITPSSSLLGIKLRLWSPCLD